jgi:sugar phosphate isomerase/epimerase
MSVLTRRQFCAATAFAAFTVGAVPEARRGCTLSIGTYSMKGMPLEEAIGLIASIGFDGIEIATQPGFDGEPAKLSSTRRAAVRRRLDDSGLTLTALMEQITPTTDEQAHHVEVERLGRVADLSRALGRDPARPPLIQTVLGGGVWDEKKSLFRDRLGDWIEATRARRVVLAIKPHRGGALSRPEEGVWLIRQLGDTPWLRLVYDYSHYAYREMSLEDTVRTALPYTAQVAVKDVRLDGHRVVFELPGAVGTIDYARLLRLLFDGGYRGDICCEVSSMLSSRAGYDPASAARTSYTNMARAFEKAGVPRTRVEGR